MKFLHLVSLVFLICACASQQNKYLNDPNVLHLVVLHTNDIHGHAWPTRKSDGKVWGGFSTQAKLVANIREQIAKESGELILLSAGDVNTGVPESDLLQAEPDFFSMNKIGYDAMVLGNHEFDKGTDKILLQKKWAKFPLLSANVHFKKSARKTGELVAPSTFIERAGVKIGIVGLTTDSLLTFVLPAKTKNLEVEPVLHAAKREIASLKSKKADLIFALTHIGVGHGDSKHSKKIGTLDEKLAESESDISLIVGGHSHTLLKEGMRVKNTLVVQAGEKGENLGRVDLYWDKQNKKLLESTATVIPITSEIGEDAALSKELDAFKAKVGTQLDKVVGHTSVLLDGERNRVRYLESNLGNLVTDILKDFTHADLAVYNGGGIRSSIAAGSIKLRDIYLAFPFNNTIQTARVTGKQLKILFQQSLANIETIGSFLHISGGSYSAKDGKITGIKIGGKPVEENKTYTLATNSFVMSGGDFFSILLDATDLKETGVTVDQAIVSYLQKHPSIAPKIEGRIIVEKP